MDAAKKEAARERRVDNVLAGLTVPMREVLLHLLKAQPEEWVDLVQLPTNTVKALSRRRLCVLGHSGCRLSKLGVAVAKRVTPKPTDGTHALGIALWNALGARPRRLLRALVALDEDKGGALLMRDEDAAARVLERYALAALDAKGLIAAATPDGRALIASVDREADRRGKKPATDADQAQRDRAARVARQIAESLTPGMASLVIYLYLSGPADIEATHPGTRRALQLRQLVETCNFDGEANVSLQLTPKGRAVAKWLEGDGKIALAEHAAKAKEAAQVLKVDPTKQASPPLQWPTSSSPPVPDPPTLGGLASVLSDVKVEMLARVAADTAFDTWKLGAGEFCIVEALVEMGLLGWEYDKGSNVKRLLVTPNGRKLLELRVTPPPSDNVRLICSSRQAHLIIAALSGIAFWERLTQEERAAACDVIRTLNDSIAAGAAYTTDSWQQTPNAG